MARQECGYYENTAHSWSDITTDVTSSNGYTAPYNMMCCVVGSVANTGTYYVYATINGTSEKASFSGYSNTNYRIAHHFYVPKGSVVKSHQDGNVNSIKYYMAKID